MTAQPDRALLQAALQAIDAVQAQDPVRVHDGTAEIGRELLLARRATHWLLALAPAADAAQQVAVRAHHLERWEVQRTAYPDGRAGYLRWRRDQKQRHAEGVARLLAEIGWPADAIEEVARLVRKAGGDARAQVHEDALCLAFLEVQLADVVARLGEERSFDVLAKTARKMSPAGLALVAQAVQDGPLRRLVEQAAAGA